jgi:hypothetical protein
MACLTIRNFPRMRSHRTRTTHSLVPSADYFTTTLKTYAYNKKSIQTLTSVARLALNIIYTVYGHGTRILLYTAYGRACNTVFVYFSTLVYIVYNSVFVCSCIRYIRSSPKVKSTTVGTCIISFPFSF